MSHVFENQYFQKFWPSKIYHELTIIRSSWPVLAPRISQGMNKYRNRNNKAPGKPLLGFHRCRSPNSDLRVPPFRKPPYGTNTVGRSMEEQQKCWCYILKKDNSNTTIADFLERMRVSKSVNRQPKKTNEEYRKWHNGTTVMPSRTGKQIAFLVSECEPFGPFGPGLLKHVIRGVCPKLGCL